MKALSIFAKMSRYRIVQRPSRVALGKAIFETEERHFLWWKYRGLHLSLIEAEEYVLQLKNAEQNPVQRKVVKEYNY
jgi:hypothetical protein